MNRETFFYEIAAPLLNKQYVPDSNRFNILVVSDNPRHMKALLEMNYKMMIETMSFQEDAKCYDVSVRGTYGQLLFNQEDFVYDYTFVEPAYNISGARRQDFLFEINSQIDIDKMRWTLRKVREILNICKSQL